MVGLFGLFAAGATSSSAAVFTVTTTADVGPGSLRQAMTSANMTAGHDEVHFAIRGRGVHTIGVWLRNNRRFVGLPTVTGPLTIDGSTQPGFAGTPLIHIANDGDAALTGLSITAGDSQVRSLWMSGFRTSISVRTGDANVIAGNRLEGNEYGLEIASESNMIGGTTRTDRNVISGNTTAGVLISGAGNVVAGNRIGTDRAGTESLPNGVGVDITNIDITNGGANTVGGTTDAARNVISGNTTAGVRAGGGTTVVAGNFIGTSASGSEPLPNGAGVIVSGHATIGGTTRGARNVISGNTTEGVRVESDGRSSVVGNFIGTTASGNAPLPNARGVLLLDYGSRVGNGDLMDGGRDRSTSGNLISGNTGAGVEIVGVQNEVRGNDIGVNAAGTAALPNAVGVVVSGGWWNEIGLPWVDGGGDPGGAPGWARNVISGNTRGGVEIIRGSVMYVKGNLIGTTPRGGALPNGGFGIRLAGSTVTNVIGGRHSSEANVISANSGDGVLIEDTPDNRVQGNFIGTTVAGNGALGNGGFGVRITGTLARQSSAYGNVISANASGGVAIENMATANSLGANFIGTSAAGLSPLPNAGDGVTVASGAGNNTIGGVAQGNTIAFNAGNGVSVNGPATLGNAILGNAILDNALLGISVRTGGNNESPAPVIGSVITTTERTEIKGRLARAVASTSYRIEFFLSAACDASGAGEGTRLIGTQTLTTDATGAAPYTLRIPAVAPGQTLTATATPTTQPQSTSQFSHCATT
ncbi:beta strand repeat-containing protein [Capillimicrobium parvum]|uniref:beta strand repeat-containing protein n=1 Tax=Capillimicrobium parvum TaxID=2884022 RepID=UPI00216B3378|nr:hypothetical protein [Capillimicrobium parvum]